MKYEETQRMTIDRTLVPLTAFTTLALSLFVQYES